MFLLKRQVAFSLILFAVTLCLGGFSILTNQQLHYMGGMAEEYFDMAVSLYYRGKLSADSIGARVFRPPAYPFFIASVLRIWGGMPEEGEVFDSREDLEQKQQAAYNAICLAQCILLSFSTVVLFLLMSRYMRLHSAFVLAFLFGCNPYLLILCGLFHYGVFHIFLTVCSCYALSGFIDSRPEWYGIKMILAGAIWGLTTLARPMTLILPAFVFVMFLIKFKLSWRLGLKWSVLFTLGMALVVAPNTIHNYYLTGRFVPVNAQGSTALWAGTVTKLQRSPNHFRWWGLWYKDGMAVFRKVTGAEEYSYSEYVNNIIEHGDEFRREAIKNLRLKPGVYCYNVFGNFITFNLDINSVFIKVFGAIQDRDVKIDKGWFKVGHPQDFYPSFEANAFKYYIYLLTLFGFAGVCIAAKQKDKSLLVAGLVYLCFCLAHCLTYMDLMYYYIKVPFLYIFTGYFINAFDRCFVKVPVVGWKISPAVVLGGLMIVYGVWLTAAIIL